MEESTHNGEISKAYPKLNNGKTTGRLQPLEFRDGDLIFALTTIAPSVISPGRRQRVRARIII